MIVDVHVLMRDEKEGREKQARSNEQRGKLSNIQCSTPKAVTFPKKNELPRVGLEPTTLYTLDRALSGVCICTLWFPMYCNMYSTLCIYMYSNLECWYVHTHLLHDSISFHT